MPREVGSTAFEGQSLKGMELDVRLEDQSKYASLYSATALDVQVAAATTSRQHTLNVGSRTSTGAAGEITATCDVFVVPDSPGQYAINRAFRTGTKVRLRRTLFSRRVMSEGEPTAGVALASGVTIAIGASPAAAGVAVPKSGGLITYVDGASGGTLNDLRDLMREVQPGMTLQIDTDNYFIGYRGPDVSGNVMAYVSPSPDDGAGTPKSLIDGYPYIGTAIAAKSSGNVKLFTGRIQETVYTGTVTVPIVATDAAPGDDGNDLSTAQISFALDDIGEVPTGGYTFPS